MSKTTPRACPQDGLASVSCMVPVYQCAERLEPHIRMVRALRPVLGQVIWVATASQDGSHEMARREAESCHDEYLEAPRGLYQSWNFGIARARQPFTYISTVGEHMEPQGLVRLVDRMVRLRATAAFSPPRLEPRTAEAVRRTRHWPVMQHRRLLRVYAGRIVPTPIVARLQLLSGISCLLGSCASCLFETAFLQAHPFPSDFNHYGDTAWFYSHLTKMRVAYLHERFSTYHVHDNIWRPVEPRDLTRCIKVFIETYRARYPSTELIRRAYALQLARAKLNQIRGPRPQHFWWLNPLSWFWRFSRTWLSRLIHAELLGQIVLDACKHPFRPQLAPKQPIAS